MTVYEDDEEFESGEFESYGGLEPGLDRHDWASEYATLQDELESDPVEALPELLALAQRILAEGGIDDEAVASAGVEPGIREELQAARDVVARIRADDRPDPGDVAQAIGGLRELIEGVIAGRSSL